MVMITIRLVGEESDKLFERVEMDPQIHIENLVKQIESVTNVPSRFQQIKFRGDRLPSSIRPLEKITYFEEIVVNHALLSHWSALLEFETNFQQTNEPEIKKSIYNRSTAIFKALMDSNFFVVYATLNSRFTSIQKRFFTYFDRKVEAIKNSCRIYFKKIYGETIEVTFGSREDGSRAGCLCILNNGSKISKFYVKTHHGEGDASSHTRYDVDLKELFVYKFLEELKMGAEIHFIDNEAFSKCIVYIGSREISGFKTLEFLELTQPQNLKEYSKFVVQMLFVYTVLMLGDNHAANMGFDCDHHPFIVDFFIIGKPLTGVKDLNDSVRLAKNFNTILGTFDERLKTSTDYLKSSNFSVVFEKSIDSFLQHQKPLFDKKMLIFDKPQKMDDLKEYVEKVRKNIRLFADYSFDKK